MDDAVHIVSSFRSGWTLCDQPAEGLNVVSAALAPDHDEDARLLKVLADERNAD